MYKGNGPVVIITDGVTKIALGAFGKCKGINRFANMFLIASWIMYLTRGRDLVGGLFLLFSGMYAILDIIRRIYNVKRKPK